ncbi:hypothetical protein LH460_06220 [Laribacter hongkongensis]|uniref:hypothetical protein n=1 Tax=Laribacter hongkongensis TaxID=168471 RepID=UPI001EFED728|nr:hypothetical protein [Laribacter hongkongensis]MCG9124266.1 hypothetical protein [Laribacter hongkongensis]
MNVNRKVEEIDFRMPEFRHANPDDYEFREDGKIVRKDRWEVGIRKIAAVVIEAGSDFEICDVVNKVEEGYLKPDSYPRKAQYIVDQTNEIAVLISTFMGYELTSGQFHKATATRGRAIWNLACEIQELMTDTDVENALQEIEEESDQEGGAA